MLIGSEARVRPPPGGAKEVLSLIVDDVRNDENDRREYLNSEFEEKRARKERVESAKLAREAALVGLRPP
jgi:hypothetical protein